MTSYEMAFGSPVAEPVFDKVTCHLIQYAENKTVRKLRQYYRLDRAAQSHCQGDIKAALMDLVRAIGSGPGIVMNREVQGTLASVGRGLVRFRKGTL